MGWKDVRESDLVGTLHIRLEEPYIPNYFTTIDRLRPLFDNNEFKRHISGYYIVHDSDDGKDTLRVKYFTSKSAALVAEEIIEKFIKDSGLPKHKSFSPYKEEVSKDYCGQELSFRRFLALETCIGLELIEKTNLEERYPLIIKFRGQNPRLRQNPGKNVAVSSLLESALELHSKTFYSLKPAEKSFLWRGLSNHRCEWPHFFVCLVCGGDIS